MTVAPEFFVGWTQSADDTDPQYLIEYEISVNRALSPLAVSAESTRAFVYATLSGANTFTVKAVDQAATRPVGACVPLSARHGSARVIA